MTATGAQAAGVPTDAAPSPAVAPPPGNPRFALFDSLRGIAVLFILAYHVGSITGALNGSTGGDALLMLGNQALILFFVISGFLLYRPFVSARAAGRGMPNVKRYFRRRVLRIVPAYWLALTVLAIFPGIVGVFTGDWWRFYGFSQLYSHSTLPQGIPPAWSLCVEVTFYLTLPLWALLLRRLRPASGPLGWVRPELLALGGLALFGALMQLLAERQVIGDLVAQSLLGQSVWLALGMGLAVASVAVDRMPREPWLVRVVAAHPAVCWLVALAAAAGLTALVAPGGLFGLIVALRSEQPYARILGTILLTGLLAVSFVLPAVFGDDRGGTPRRLLALAPVAWLGLVSYGVYLYHLTIAEILGVTKDPAHFSATGLGLADKIHHFALPILYVLTLAGACLAAAISYYGVELRFLRLKER